MRRVRKACPLPCPFCGKSFLVLEEFGDETDEDDIDYWVQCEYESCEVPGPHRPTEALAVAAWNHRPLS